MLSDLCVSDLNVIVLNPTNSQSRPSLLMMGLKPTLRSVLILPTSKSAAVASVGVVWCTSCLLMMLRYPPLVTEEGGGYPSQEGNIKTLHLISYRDMIACGIIVELSRAHVNVLCDLLLEISWH